MHTLTPIPFAMPTLTPAPPSTYSTGARAAAPVADGAAVDVLPGQMVAGKAEELTTVVGSGVVVCIWDPIYGVGGMAHFLLPEAGNAPPAPRYGDVGMRMLVEQLGKLGANLRGLRGAVFGGSAPPIASESGHLGDRNVDAALSYLKLCGVLVVKREVGGAGARKVVFNPRAGATQVTRIGG